MKSASTIPTLPARLDRFGMLGGYAILGVSGFALLAAGPRILGPDGYSALAMAWTVVTIISIGITTSGEQVVTRAVSAGAGLGTVRPLARRLFVITGVVLLLVPLFGRGTPGGTGRLTWYAAIVLASFAFAWLAPYRGQLAGRAEFGAYSLVLACEGCVRLALVALAALLPSAGTVLLAAAVVVPVAVSAVLSRTWARRLDLPDDGEIADDTRLEQLSITTVSGLLQVCLNTAQIWLYQQSPDPAAAGAYVTAASYMRIPLVLAGSIYTPLLNAAATAYAAGDRPQLLRKTGIAVGLGGLGSMLMCAVLLALSPLGMAILYGPEQPLPIETFLWLGLSTVATLAASVMTNALFGCRRAPMAAVIWFVPTAIASIVYASAGGSPTVLAMGSAVSQVAATILLAVAFVVRALPPRTVQHRTSN